MTNKVKYILISLGIIAVGTSVIAANKIATLKNIFDKMTIVPVGISKLKINLTSISFLLDIKITNPTGDDFAISGFSVASLRKLNIFYKGNYLGSAAANITEISIPKQNELIIHDIPVEVATQAILQNIMTITNISINDITIEAVVSVAGNEYKIAN
jgi:hypothetical protein